MRSTLCPEYVVPLICPAVPVNSPFSEAPGRRPRFQSTAFHLNYPADCDSYSADHWCRNKPQLVSSPDRYAPIGGAANDDNLKRTVTLLRRYRRDREVTISTYCHTAAGRAITG